MSQGSVPPFGRGPPRRQTFTDTEPEHAYNFKDKFRIDVYRGAYQRYDGAMSAEQSLVVFERGDSAAALLFDPTLREVILVEQFRLPAALRQESGWILEPAAGIIEKGETPREAIISELQEETGYRVTDLEEIGDFFVSPGAATERIFLYYAEVQLLQQQGGGGLAKDGENIRTVRIPVVEFMRRLANRDLKDAKLIIAAQWLKDRLATRPPHEAAYSPPEVRRLKTSPQTRKGRGASSGKYVGYWTGDILNVTGVDVWVNPLNTDMHLDRFNDPTVSAKIRFHGAARERDSERLEEDTIGDEIRKVMGRRRYVAPATIIETPPGRLKLNGVKSLLHVATSKGNMGKDYPIDADTLVRCVTNVLEAVATRYSSVLIPMLGTGGGQFDVRQVAPLLLGRAVRFFQERPESKLQYIYFLPYTEIDAAIFADAMKKAEEQFEPAAVVDPSRGA